MEPTKEQIEKFCVDLMKKDPVKFTQYCLLVIGKDLFKTGVESFKFEQQSDLEKGRRFEIKVSGTIKEVMP